MVSDFLRTSFVLLSAVTVLLLGVLMFYPSDFDFNNDLSDNKIQKFNSPEEIESFLKEQTQSNNYWGGGMIMEATMDMAVTKSVSSVSGGAPTASSETQGSVDDFSTTNIQVKGVDEADIVKNDGKYIYTLSGNTLSIVNAYPPQDANLISTISLEDYAQELYINDNKLIVLGNKNIDYLVPVIEPSGDENPQIATKMMPIRRSSTHTFAKTYDISDKENPKLIKTTTVDGNYHDSRMIGNNVYIIATQYTYYNNIRIPELQTTLDEKTTNKTLDVYYFDVPDNSYSFTSIVSINVKDDTEESKGKIYLLGSTSNLYVSMNNIYVTYQKQLPRTYYYEQMITDVLMPLVPTAVSTQIKLEQTLNKSEWEKQQATENIIQDYSESLDKEEQKTLEEQIEV
ncbi:MAG: beta-propeller domain-containing protein, partial [Candidatus Aenigmarchaeota archaeon]|nr:beta-propeller domain-containing protein [Candidatus Aenigmarchaeota archaeon]